MQSRNFDRSGKQQVRAGDVVSMDGPEGRALGRVVVVADGAMLWRPFPGQGIDTQAQPVQADFCETATVVDSLQAPPPLHAAGWHGLATEPAAIRPEGMKCMAVAARLQAVKRELAALLQGVDLVDGEAEYGEAIDSLAFGFWTHAIRFVDGWEGVGGVKPTPTADAAT